MPQKSMGLLEEAYRMAKLNHPNIVKIIAVNKLSFQAFRPMIALEWLAGGSLAEYFREHIRVSSKLAFGDTAPTFQKCFMPLFFVSKS